MWMNMAAKVLGGDKIREAGTVWQAMPGRRQPGRQQ
jgi:hypothetical protein